MEFNQTVGPIEWQTTNETIISSHRCAIHARLSPDRRREQVHAVFRIVPGNSETVTPIQRSRLHDDWKRRTQSYNVARASVCVCVRARKTITVKPFGPILTQPAIAIMDRRVGITRCRARILRSCLCLDSCTRVHAIVYLCSWTPREFPESYDSPTTSALDPPPQFLDVIFSKLPRLWKTLKV